MEFRRSLAASFLFKALLWASQQLEGDAPAYASPFPDTYRSGGCWFAFSSMSHDPQGGWFLCLRFHQHSCFLGQPQRYSSAPPGLPPPRAAAAAKPYERPPSHGLQYFSAAPGEDVVGQPVRHMAADQQVGSGSLGF